MGKGWRNTAPKPKGHRISDMDPEALSLYTEIRLLAKKHMQRDYARELYEYRVRYRYGRPGRIHYSWKTRRLLDLLDRFGRNKISAFRAEIELYHIKRE